MSNNDEGGYYGEGDYGRGAQQERNEGNERAIQSEDEQT